MSPAELLLVNLALGFYAVGAIWAHEVDIFRSWNLAKILSTHWIRTALVNANGFILLAWATRAFV
jgi:hypothetical protein